MTLQRHQWEDGLIAAELLGILPPGAVNMALRPAKAITWKKTGTPELRWKNQSACDSIGVSRSTYFRHRRVLFEAGFLTEVKGNLVPRLPDLSQFENNMSQPETEESQNGTPESQFDNPYTVDTYTDDLSTVNEYTVATVPAVADAPTVPVSSFVESKGDRIPSLRRNTTPTLESGDIPESQVETLDDWNDWTPPPKQPRVAATSNPDHR